MRNKILIVILCLFIGFLFLWVGMLRATIKMGEEKFDLIKPQSMWWEMVANDCGRDDKKDMENDYCRGFGDGYLYKNDLIEFNEVMMRGLRSNNPDF